jgi:ubiquinone/menaquinone biosynthesis C-methylase UbiE
MGQKSSESRFSDRAGDYAKYRPGYPDLMVQEVIHRTAAAFPGESLRFADIGAGTGIFSRLLAKKQLSVTAIEPNDAMRAFGEENPKGVIYKKGNAQETGLEDESVHGIVSAQAFHWFSNTQTLAEFRRILKPRGVISLIWNVRDIENDPFQREYEALLMKYCPEYADIKGKNDFTETLEKLFPEGFEVFLTPNHEHLSREKLFGRMASTSYIPKSGEDGHREMMDEVGILFDRYEQEGNLEFVVNSIGYFIST